MKDLIMDQDKQEAFILGAKTMLFYMAKKCRDDRDLDRKTKLVILKIIEEGREDLSHLPQNMEEVREIDSIYSKAQKAIPALTKALKDKSDDVRKAARVALKQIGNYHE